MLEQREWEVIGQVGDENPVLYGGGIILRHSDVRDPELELYQPDIYDVYRDEDGKIVRDEDGEKEFPVHIYRFPIKRFVMHEGQLVGEREPEYAAQVPGRGVHPEWWADKLPEIFDEEALPNVIEALCSDDAVARAAVYVEICNYYGESNFDDYPLVKSYTEACKRFEKMMKVNDHERRVRVGTASPG